MSPQQADITAPRVAAGTASSARLSWGLHRYALLAALLIGFVGLVVFVAPTDPDVWWHLRDGKLIFDSGIPTYDVYSFTAEGRTWLVQEWLTELVMYAVQSTLGYWALSLLFGALQALGAFIVYLLLRSMGAGRLLALVLLMCYLVFAAPSWGVRPQVLTPVFLGTFYLLLLAYRRDPSRTRLLWALPVLMLLWTNLHASYFMGIALFGAFLVGEASNNFLYRPERPTPLRPLLVTLGACLVATLVNPYFIELWTYPLTYVLNGTSNPLVKYTQEWQSPDFHEPGNLLFALSLVALAIVGIANHHAEDRGRWRIAFSRRVDVTDAIILIAFTLMGLQAVRLVPIYGVMVLPLLARSLAGLWPALSSESESGPSPVEGRLNWLVACAGVVAAAFLLLTAPQAQTGQEPRTETNFVYPQSAADYLSTLKEPVRMINDFAWGGYLIYRLYPNQKVFIDGRADMYREGIFDDYIIAERADPGWREVLSKYGVNLAVLARGAPLQYALAHEPGWEPVHTDDVAIVYKRVK